MQPGNTLSPLRCIALLLVILATGSAGCAPYPRDDSSIDPYLDPRMHPGFAPGKTLSPRCPPQRPFLAGGRCYW